MSVNTDTGITMPVREDQDQAVEPILRLLRRSGLDPQPGGYRWAIGRVPETKDWILHLSVVITQLEDLLADVLPYLVRQGAPFEVAASKEAAKMILNGQLGYGEQGKVVSIYPANDSQAAQIAEDLALLTTPYMGPHVVTGRHLCHRVYACYGRSEVTIPFTLPAETSWPFINLAAPVAEKSNRYLHDKYRSMAVLKEDARGNVEKALQAVTNYKVRWCVIKQGRYCMGMDDEARDVGYRLRWQRELSEDLADCGILPEVLDLFEENADVYLVIELIKGTTLNDTVTGIYNGGSWWELSEKARLRLAGYGVRFIEIPEKVHLKKYVYRDLTPENILVTRQDAFKLIDPELAFSKLKQKPQPPLRYGTPGFMSPEQRAISTPDYPEDIYAVGGNLLALFTGLLPSKFSEDYPGDLALQLGFFIQDEPVRMIILKCFDSQPAARPTLSAIKETVERFRAAMPAKATPPSPIVPDNNRLREIIQCSLRGLGSRGLVSSEGIWLSKAIENPGMEYYQSEKASLYPGLGAGVSGVLYVLFRAKWAGFDTAASAEVSKRSFYFLQERFGQLAQLPGGLYNGTAGVAWMLSEYLKGNILTDANAGMRDMIACLERGRLEGCTVANGLAGRLMAVLHSDGIMGQDFVVPLVENLAGQLLFGQQKDGSWITEPTERSGHQVDGFGYGVAGIVCCLLSYAQQFPSEPPKKAADKALRWMIRRSSVTRGGWLWPNIARQDRAGWGLDRGASGTILALIKGYEVLGDLRYKRQAEAVLNKYPFFISGRDLTLSGGLAGIGETYLEAAKVFQAEEYEKRAGWIAQLLLHHYKRQPDGSLYWQADHIPYDTADLLTGNSGIIHFLLRYYSSGKLSHPLLPW